MMSIKQETGDGNTMKKMKAILTTLCGCTRKIKVNYPLSLHISMPYNANDICNYGSRRFKLDMTGEYSNTKDKDGFLKKSGTAYYYESKYKGD